MDSEIMEEYIQEYIQTMKPHEKTAYDIAVKQLESSFDITKSIGFIEFMKSKPVSNET